MKAVILAGGLGTRLSEETTLRPKPMVEIGGKPILWHIMKIYSAHGINEFIICLGYLGYVIKEYFANYVLHNSDVTFDIEKNNIIVHQKRSEPWKITLVDTGELSGTGGRLRRVREYLGDEDFCFTYGDGVSDVDISVLIERHRQEGTLATLTAIQPESKYGVLTFNGNRIVKFREKPSNGGSWINGGFFVLSPKVIDYIESDETHFEHMPLKNLAADGQLSALFHSGFWQCMDTLRDKNHLEEMWNTGEAPWKCWK
jgi:glucose-1-phosphate cytidylyltransferase